MNHRSPRRVGTVLVATVLASLTVTGCQLTEPVPVETGAPSPPHATGVIDSCLIGTWQEINYESDIDLSHVSAGTARVRGAGRTLTFSGDGRELVDYGDGVTYQGAGSAGEVEQTVSGTVEFQVTTRDGWLSFRLVTGDTRFEYRLDGELVDSWQGGWNPADVSYTCDGDTLTQAIRESYQAEYRRVSDR